MVGYCSKEVGVSIKVVGEGMTPLNQLGNECFVRRIWAYEISFFVRYPELG